MYRTVRKKEKRRDLTIQRWHIRTLVPLNGCTMVTLPARLIKWDRTRSSEPYKWEAGDQVQIGMLPNGDFVIRAFPWSSERGYNVDAQAVLSNEYADELLPAQMPKKFRRKRRVRVWGDAGVEEEKWVDDDEHMTTVKKRESWADEVRKFRKFCDFNQDEAADRLHVTRVSISRWETGDQVPGEYKRAKYRDKMLSIKKVFAEERKDHRRKHGRDK